MCNYPNTRSIMCNNPTSPSSTLGASSCCVLIFTHAVLSGQQSCFLSNQKHNQRHMVLFMKEGDKCGVWEHNSIREDNCKAFW